MAGPMKATDSHKNARLLNPACGIPPDIHFEIEDQAGARLAGNAGGTQKHHGTQESGVQGDVVWADEGNRRPHQDQIIDVRIQDNPVLRSWC